MLRKGDQMKRILLFSISFAAVTMSLPSLAYQEAWEDFDASQLDAIAEDTMGTTQDLLDEREGKIECIACHGEADDEYAGVLNSVEIAAYTMEAALSCLDLEVVGACVWMTCLPGGCSFQTTAKVKNFVPELVIQAYDRANGEPWTESQDLNQISQGDADSSWVMNIINLIESIDLSNIDVRGGSTSEAHKGQHANLTFKLADAYGNPSIIPFNALASSTGGYVCGGTVTPFFPYFISNLDSIAWRWDVPEMFYPQSLAVIGGNNLGNALNNYGPIYPRHGFMTAQDPLKAATLAAYRLAHIVTRKNEPHLYFTIDKDSDDGYWPPGSLDEDDDDTGQWQMLYPEKETSCRDFPYGGNPSASRRSTDGSYIWNFWRAFKCCPRGGMILVGHTG